MTVIRVRDLTKTYRLYDKPRDRLKEALHPLRRKYHREHYALRDVNFEVKRGETLGIVGRNGSGKSTLLKILAGTVTPTQGSALVLGTVSSLLELGAGFHPDFTGMENVYFGGALLGYTRREMEERLDDILSFADIGEYVHQPVRVYSSGMYVRLAFAVAVHVEPEVLLLDEVLAVGDLAFQNKCLRRITRIAEAGSTTVLFVTHDLNALRLLCGRAILLEEGRIRRDGHPPRVIDEYTGTLFGRLSARTAEPVTASLLDRRNQSVDRIGSRAPATMALDLDGLDLEQGLLLAIRFVNLDSRFSHRIETDRFRHLRGSLRGVRIVARFRELNLPPGPYALNVSVSDGSYLRRIHHVEEALWFRVAEGQGDPPYLDAEWGKADSGRLRVGLVGWWRGGNEGDRFLLETLGEAFGDAFDTYPVPTEFPPNPDVLSRLNALDFLVVGGGGLFTLSPPRPFDTFDQWGDGLRIPLAVVGVGVQEVRPEHEEAVSRLARRSVHFVVRDEESLEQVRRFAPGAVKAPDLSFFRPREADRVAEPSATGVNLRAWNFDRDRAYDNRAWCDAVNSLPGEKVTIPLSFAEGLSDVQAMEGIEGSRSERFDLSLYSDVRVMVGMRLHSLIFAAQNGIPIVGIAYAPKVRRFFREIGLPEFCLGLDEMGRLREVFDEAVRRRQALSSILLRYTESASREVARMMEMVKRSILSAVLPRAERG